FRSGREAATDANGGESLVPISPNEPAKVLGIDVAQNETKPPARFTEATLLSAMEGAGKLVEDEELREAMREKGLGTPATRSAIIEGLIHDRSEEHTSELQSRFDIVCRLLLEKKNEPLRPTTAPRKYHEPRRSQAPTALTRHTPWTTPTTSMSAR